MKFVYIDESGSAAEGDAFVMCGLMIDAYKLRTVSAEFDSLLRKLLSRARGKPARELKTKRFIDGKGQWNCIDGKERQSILIEFCTQLVESDIDIYGIGLSFSAFNGCTAQDSLYTVNETYGFASAMFITALVQKHMQKVKGKKGRSIIVFDDNKMEMSNLAGAIYHPHCWYDGLYMIQEKKRGKLTWIPRTESDRFDQVIDTAYSIESQYSYLVQLADAISYIYRRDLELQTAEEGWDGEKDFYRARVEHLDSRRKMLGRAPDEECVRFYQDARHPGWKL